MTSNQVIYTNMINTSLCVVFPAKPQGSILMKFEIEMFKHRL